MIKKFKKITAYVMAVICCTVVINGINVSAETADNSADYIMGDVNADGKFTIADVILFQNWLVGKDVTLNNRKAVDFHEDGTLNVFDLCMMKNELLSYNSSEEYPVKKPVVIDEFQPCTATADKYFDNWHIAVYIKHQYSVTERTWTKDDFKGVENIFGVQQYEENAPYRQYLNIILKQGLTQEEVLKVIHDIEALNLPEIWCVKVRISGLGDELVDDSIVVDVLHYID